VGKTAFALELAEALGAWIVSMDSMQVYRRMDVGTAKPTAAERARVPHLALDLVEPSESYDVQRYLSDARAAVEAARARGRRALFVGGSGLYLKALARGLHGGPGADPVLRADLEQRAQSEGAPALHAELLRVDPAAAARIHPNDKKRVVRALEMFRQTGRPLSDWQREWGWHGHPHGQPLERPSEERELRIVGLRLGPEELASRVRSRVQAMLTQGWVDEAVAIRRDPGFGPTAIQALGYREVLAHADGALGRAELEERLVQRTRQFIRRQGTWFRSFAAVRWIDSRSAGALAEARALLEG